MPETQPAEAAPLEPVPALLEKVRHGRVLIAKNSPLPLAVLNMWSGSTRIQLKRLFGDSAALVHRFQKIEGGVSPDRVLTTLAERTELLSRILESVAELGDSVPEEPLEPCIFIGHGRSPHWREFRDFLQGRLRLQCDEFNSESAAGLSTIERLMDMRNRSTFAFLVMTAEDEHADTTIHARENVVHEVGFFQGHLGPRKAIILLEQGCQEFSNVVGLGQIRFPPGQPGAAFEQIRQVLEREGVIPA